MTEPDDTPFDTALRQQLQRDGEPGDDGFSLRVMAALPDQPPRRRRARWVRQAQWLASSLAACGAAVLLDGGGAPPDTPQALAGLALVGLLVFWLIPSRWSRG